MPDYLQHILSIGERVSATPEKIRVQVDNLPISTVEMALAEEGSRSCIGRRDYKADELVQTTLRNYSSDNTSQSNIDALRQLYTNLIARGYIKIRENEDKSISRAI